MINNEYTGCKFNQIGGMPYIQIINSGNANLSSKVLSTVTYKIPGTNGGQTFAVSFLLEAGDVLGMSAHWDTSVTSGTIIAKVCAYY